MTVTIPTKAQHDAVDTRLKTAENTLAAATKNAVADTVVKRDAFAAADFAIVGINDQPGAASHATRRDYVNAQDAAHRREQRTVLAAGTASYTLALGDEGDLVGFTGGDTDAKNVVVPANATVPFPVGGWVDLYRSGAHTVTVTPAAGVTVLAPDGNLTIRAQNATVRLLKLSTDGWLLLGDNNDAVAQAVTAATKSAVPDSVVRRDAFAAADFAIVGVGEQPTAPSHATRKDYVDTVPYVSLRQGVAQTIQSATFTLLLWDVENFDPDGLHDAATAPERITVTRSGLYLANANLALPGHTAAHRRLIRLRVNGIAVNNGTRYTVHPAATAGDIGGPTVTRPVQLAAGDFVDVTCWQNSGSPLDTILGVDGSSLELVYQGAVR